MAQAAVAEVGERIMRALILRRVGLFESGGYEQLVGAESAPIPEGQVSPAYVYVRVEDVETAATRVEEAGGRLLSPLAPRSWGEDAAWFADPDGNVIAVAQSA